MHGRYVQVCPPDGGRREEGRMYSRKSVCFYEKQTPLQYLHPLAFFSTLFIFLSCLWENKWGRRRGGHSAVKPLPLRTRDGRKEGRDEKSVVKRNKTCRFLCVKNKRFLFGRPVGTRRGRSTTSCLVNSLAVTWGDLRGGAGGLKLSAQRGSNLRQVQKERKKC